jgi:CHASE2 domain-containing sensor protein
MGRGISARPARIAWGGVDEVRDAIGSLPPSVEDFLRAAAIRAAFGLVLALAVLALGRLGPLRRLEDRVLDRRIVLWRQLSEADTSGITLVAIDPPALDELHSQWPLPRGVYARAIDRLRRSGATAIGVTVVFEGASADPLGDQALGAAVEGGDTVLASRLDLRQDAPTVVTPPFKAPSGFCEVPLDLDGVARQFYVAAAGLDPPPICMALALLRAHYRNLQFVPRGFVDDPGTLYPIAWAGAPEHTFHTISLKKVLAGGDISKDVKGNIVIVGSTLPSASNSIRTPFARRGSVPPTPAMSTVELTANLVFSLLGNDSLRTLSRAEKVCLIGGLVFVCFMLFGSLHPLFSLVCTGFLIALYGVGATYAMVMNQRELPLVLPLAGLALAWGAAAAYRVAWRMVRRRVRA